MIEILSYIYILYEYIFTTIHYDLERNIEIILNSHVKKKRKL